ncbi:MAG: LPS export ABC transporter permease LptF [Thermodesulfobacteriota bacterium]|nr:LPS export ABC transporter permease LptF [Thermodesulfobacteriota bacterium]
MSASRIQTYIVREVTVPFLLGIVLFTFVLLLSRLLKLIELIVDKGVPVGEIFAVFATLMPSFFVITVPLSFLLGTIIAFGRLSADSEIVAMKAAGFSMYRLAQPVIILAIFVCLFTAALTLYAEPYGRANLRQRLIDMAYSKAALAIQPQIFNEEIDGLVLYANKVESETGHLQGVFISDNRVGQTPAVITAHQGKIYSDRTNGKILMHLQQGSIHRLQQRSETGVYQVVHFNSYDINLSFNNHGQQGSGKALKSKEMSTTELLKQIDITKEDKQLEYMVELNERLILPLSPLIFALVAIPLGIRSHRSNRGGGFAVALVVFLLYYLLLSISKTMVIENGWSLLVSMWGPIALFFTLSLALLHCTARERPVPGSQLFIHSINFITHRFPGKR